MQIEGIGKNTARKLSELTDHDCSVLFEASKEELIESIGLSKELAEKISQFDGWSVTDQIMKNTAQLNCTLIGLGDVDYPFRLYHIYDPPPLLWVHGRVEALALHGLAIVGTRNPSIYGREMAEYWVEQLSGFGISFISGFARGIDTVVHKTAIDCGEVTIAVLGSGIDRVYPSENRRFIRKMIQQGGAIVTEYPPETGPLSIHFPARNRIVSGLSAGVIIIESGVKGGSMITARCANDEGRELFVVPHALTSEKGEGGNGVLKRGEGKLIQTRKDLFDELPWLLEDDAEQERVEKGEELQGGESQDGVTQGGVAQGGMAQGQVAQDGVAQGQVAHGMESQSGAGRRGKARKAYSSRRRWQNCPMDDVSKKICTCLSEQSEPIRLDQLSQKTGYPVHELMLRIMTLEMDRIIEQRAGNRIKLR